MKSFLSFVVSGVVAAVLVVSGASAARADDPPQPAPVTLDLTGELSALADQESAPSSVVPFRVEGEGYLPIDFSGLALEGQRSKTITVRLEVPAVLVDASGAAPGFDELTDYALSTAPLRALQILTYQQPRVSAMVNQSATVSATHKIFAVVVTPANVAGTAATSSQSPANIAGAVASTNSYWMSQSNGTIGFELVGTTLWYRSAYSCTSGNFFSLTAEARSRAVSQLGYVDTYNNHLALFFPSGSNCGSAIGTGTIGSTVNSGGELWVIGTESATSRNALSHELGHNLSLGHANWLDCPDATPSPGVSGTEDGCTQYSYGDVPDVMSAAWGVSTGGSLSSTQAIRAGVWPSSSYVEATPGTHQFALQGISTNAGLRSVIVEDNAGINYFVEYRDLGGRDAPYVGMGCAPWYCMSAPAGVRVLKLESGQYYKAAEGDQSQLIGRTIGGVRRTTYVASESFSNNDVVITVDSIVGGVATVSVTRGAVTPVTGSVSIQCAVCVSYPIRSGDTLMSRLGGEWRADSYAFQWYRGETAIDGATSQNYTVVPADAGYLLKLTVTASTAGYDPVTVTTNYWSPVYTSTIVPGTVSINADALPFVATVANWLPFDVSYSYQWLRNGASIAGATSVNYRPTAADDGALLSVRVTAKRYDLAAVSATSAAKNYTVTATGSLLISGDPAVGEQLSVNLLDYSSVDGPIGSPTRTYQWYRSGVAISGATASTFTATGADAGKLLTVKVTGRAPGYAAHVAISPATTVVVRGDIAGSLAAPIVVETPSTKVLAVSLADGSITEGDVFYAFQWLRDDVAIAGAVGDHYTLVAADYGKLIRARVVVTKLGFNSAALWSEPRSYSLGATGDLVVLGTARVGEVLSASDLSYALPSGDPVVPALSYQWLRAGVVIAGATASTYSATAADLGKKLSVRVTASVEGVLSHSATSTQTAAIVAGVLPGTHDAPIVSKNAETMVLTAALAPDSITVEPVTVTFQWYRDGVALVGATTSTYRLTAADYGKAITARLVVAKTAYVSKVLLSAPANYSLVGSPVKPSFTGPAAVGGVLELTARDWLAGGSPTTPDSESPQWLRNGVAIPGATGPTYTLTASDTGTSISVRVTAHKSGYLDSVATSSATQPIGAAVIAGSSTAVHVALEPYSMTLYAHHEITEAAPVTISYQWYRNGAAVTGATGATYKLVAADAGKLLAVRLIATKPTKTSFVSFSQPQSYSIAAVGSLAAAGTPRVGETLTASELGYTTPEGIEIEPTAIIAASVDASPTLSYQWLRGGGVIPGAVGPTYQVQAPDYGARLQVRVTAQLFGYLPNTVTSTGTPVISRGVLAGSMAAPVVTKDAGLKLTVALPDGAISTSVINRAYQWYRNGVAIPLATGSQFQLTAADYNRAISVRVVVSKLNYTSVALVSAATNYSLVARTAASFTGVPAIGGTFTAVGRTFDAGAELDVTPTLSYQWLRDGVVITGATAESYSPSGPADLGRAISLRVTATYPGYLTSVSTSAATQKLGASAFGGYDALPTVQKSGLVLTAVPGVSEPGTNFARQWYRNGVAVYLATGSSYTLTGADYGKSISVRVIASKAGFTTVVATSVPVNYSVTAVGALTASGTARVGMLLTASALSYSTTDGAVSPTLTYQWLHNGVIIPGATAASYTAAASDYGTKLQVRVTAAVAGFLSNTTTSAATAVVAKGVFTGTMAPPIISSDPFTFKLTVALAPGSIDQSGYTPSYQWYRNGVAIPLATGANYSLTAGDYGKEIKAKVVVAKANYITVVQVSAAVIP